MSFKIIPSHKDYYCDFFCNPDTDNPLPLPVKELHGLKMASGGGSRNYPILLSPLNENAALHICRDCLAAFAALYHQVQNNNHKMHVKKLDEEQPLELKHDSNRSK